VRTPPALLVEIAAAREPRRQLGERAAVAAPEAPYRVAVLAVPLRPFRREVPDLVPAFAQIPRLGDQLDLRQDRVLMNDVKERTELVDSMQLTSQSAREIEAEPVDVHLGHPVAQAVHDQLQHARAAHVERVAAAGE